MSNQRNFVFLSYPESSSIDDLSNYCLSHKGCNFIAFLHDKDDKKEHYHCLLMFDSPRVVSQVRGSLETLGFAVPPNNEFICTNVKSTISYMYHIGQPEKYQYFFDFGDNWDVAYSHTLTSLKYDKFLSYLSSKAEMDTDISREIVKFVLSNGCSTFCDLTLYVTQTYPDYLTTFIKRAYFYKTLLTERNIYNGI